jgi:hypothetical protein
VLPSSGRIAIVVVEGVFLAVDHDGDDGYDDDHADPEQVESVRVREVLD